MQIRSIIRILGLLVSLFSVTMIPPAVISLVFGDGSGLPFILAFLLCLFTGLAFWYPNRDVRGDLRAKEGFLIVALFWAVLASFGALPFVLLEQPEMTITDAMFEAFSGLTTTGATVIEGIDFLPKSVQFYRQQLQWLGGMGIIVLAVAILPILGVGGMQLYRAETPGPVKDSKMTPRIADTAKQLWYIYFSLTAACALAYWAVGMDWFDAICHSFSTIAIGGFSTYDASLGHFDSTAVNLVCVVFLWIAALNFALHYGAVTGRSIKHYIYDPELRAFFFLQICLVLICFFTLMNHNWFSAAEVAFDQALIQSVSISTTAGLGRRALPDRVVEAVWGFFSAYALVFIIIMILLIGTGLDNITAFSATAATLNNLGPGLGTVAGTFADVSDSGKWVLVLAMLFGRLEVFSLLVLFSPTFWRS